MSKLVVSIIFTFLFLGCGEESWVPKKFVPVHSLFECIDKEENLVKFELKHHPDQSSVELKKAIEEFLHEKGWNGAVECYKIDMSGNSKYPQKAYFLRK